MTKGKFIAILVHCAGVAFAMGILILIVTTLTGSVSLQIISGAAIFYCMAVAWVTVRVIRGQDVRANSAAAFIDRDRV